MNAPPLTPQAFDRIARPKAPANPLGLIWGAKNIARHIGTSPDYVMETLAKEDGSPVRKSGGKYVCQIDALFEYFASSQNKPKET